MLRTFLILLLVLIGASDNSTLIAQCSDVYFYRMNTLLGSESPVLLLQDGERIAYVRSGDRFKATVCAPGEYEFLVKNDIDALLHKKVTIDIERGGEYYLRISSTLEVPGIAIRSTSEGKKDLSRSAKFSGAQKQVRVKERSVVATTGGTTATYGTSESPGFQKAQIVGNFKFEVVNITKAEGMLALDYKITNLSNNDRLLVTTGQDIYMYDDIGELINASEVCLMASCRNNIYAIKSVDPQTAEGKCRHCNSSSQISATIPYGIPVNARVVFRRIKNEATKFVRGSMVFRSGSITDHQDYFDFSLTYHDLEFPSVDDGSNPNRRNVGLQSYELQNVIQSNGSTRLRYSIYNQSESSYELKVRSGIAYDDLGNPYDVEAVSFGSGDGPHALHTHRPPDKSISAGDKLDFDLIIKGINPNSSQIRRVSVQFDEYQLTWEHISILKEDSGGTKSDSQTFPQRENLSGGSSNYVDYSDFTTRVRNNEDVVGVKVILENIYFATASDKLLDSSFPHLDELHELLSNNSTLNVEISGHTDNVGDDISNVVLSQKRADAVKYYLLGKSISPSRISSIGKGEQEFIRSNDTEEGRRENRRVEIRVLDNDE